MKIDKPYKFLKRMHEVELNRAGLLDFGDFFDIKYDVDGDGEVYPIYSELKKELMIKEKR
jgi:hypothetical protein